MSNSYVSNSIHVVFATKERSRVLNAAVRARLYPYIVALARELKIEIISIGGIEDHLHLLFALPPTISLSEAMKKLKANTSRWINETFSTNKFAWQEGYGAFSVGVASIPAAKTYIQTQAEHHKKRDYQAELDSMLRQHGMEFASLPSSGLGTE